MIVLDTNVLSELLRPSPEPTVLAWLTEQPSASLFTTAVSCGIDVVDPWSSGCRDESEQAGTRLLAWVSARTDRPQQRSRQDGQYDGEPSNCRNSIPFGDEPTKDRA